MCAGRKIEMISDERLKEIIGALCTDSLHDYEQVFDSIKNGEIGDMAKELLALRKKASCQHHWNTLKLTECSGRYQYCTLCGAKKVAE